MPAVQHPAALVAMAPVGAIAILRAQQPRAVEAHARRVRIHLDHCGQAGGSWALWAPQNMEVDTGSWCWCWCCMLVLVLCVGVGVVCLSAVFFFAFVLCCGLRRFG